MKEPKNDDDDANKLSSNIDKNKGGPYFGPRKKI